jgi:hypothetical protein
MPCSAYWLVFLLIFFRDISYDEIAEEKFHNNILKAICQFRAKLKLTWTKNECAQNLRSVTDKVSDHHLLS